MSGSFTRKSCKKIICLPWEFRGKIPCLRLNMSLFKRNLAIDLWEASMCALPCAWPWLPAQPEAREDAKIPGGWLEVFHWETPGSLFKLLPHCASLPCKKTESRVDGDLGKSFFLFTIFNLSVTLPLSHFVVCMCVCVCACVYMLQGILD